MGLLLPTSASGSPCMERRKRTGEDRAPDTPQACHLARGRQGRCAPLTQWPEEGPILDRRCARRQELGAGRGGRMVPIEQKDGDLLDFPVRFPRAV